MPSDETLAIIQSLAASAVFSAVLAGALAYAWRLYRQPYLVQWALYWGIYLVVWTLDGLSIALRLSPDSTAWYALRAAMTLGAFAARAFLAIGVLRYVGFRKPTQRGLVGVAALVALLAVASLGAHSLVAREVLPGWAALPFRTYFLGCFLAGSLAFVVLRGNPAPSQRLLGVALAVACLSDAWDVAVELGGASPWTATGEALYLSYFVVHLTDALFASGMLVAAIGTEHRRAERAAEELRHRDAAIQQAQRQETIGQLAGGLAHDFNNLLTAIIGHLALVRDAVPPGSPPSEDTGIAIEAAERAARLTRQLLTYARRQPGSPRLIDPNAVVSGLDRLVVPLLGPRIERRLALAPAPWPIEVDPSHLEQLLLNLVVNARDAMPDGGTLVVETARETLGPGPRAEDSSEVPDGEWLRITVEDTGHGMDAATRARMFEPFFTTKPAGKGSGLGLAAAHGIVQQVGGVIGVRTAPGAGTRLSVFLPRAAGPLAAAEAPPGPRRVQGETGTVLVVEDEPRVRALAARALERSGYTVLTAADGEGALAVAATSLDRIDLVLTDVAMPGIDGRALVGKLRALRPDLPVLFMSGFTSAGPGELEAPLLAKPFTPDALVARVQELTRGR